MNQTYGDHPKWVAQALLSNATGADVEDDAPEDDADDPTNDPVGGTNPSA